MLVRNLTFSDDKKNSDNQFYSVADCKKVILKHFIVERMLPQKVSIDRYLGFHVNLKYLSLKN